MAMHSVIMLIGWVFLIASWVVPKLMNKESADRSFIGAILAAISCGVFIGGLVVQLMS